MKELIECELVDRQVGITEVERDKTILMVLEFGKQNLIIRFNGDKLPKIGGVIGPVRR